MHTLLYSYTGQQNLLIIHTLKDVHWKRKQKNVLEADLFIYLGLKIFLASDKLVIEEGHGVERTVTDDIHQESGQDSGHSSLSVNQLHNINIIQYNHTLKTNIFFYLCETVY